LHIATNISTSRHFSLSLSTTSDPTGVYSIQLTATSTSVTLAFSPNQHHYFRLNHFRIHFVDNEFEKTY
jgi:hypothetical protein